MSIQSLIPAVVVAAIAAAAQIYVAHKKHQTDNRAQDEQAAATHDELELQQSNFGLDVLQSALAELHQADSDRKAEINELRGEGQELRDRLDACEQDKIELRDEISGMGEANRQLRSIVLEGNDERVRMGRRINDLSAQIDILNQQRA